MYAIEIKLANGKTLRKTYHFIWRTFFTRFLFRMMIIRRSTNPVLKRDFRDG